MYHLFFLSSLLQVFCFEEQYSATLEAGKVWTSTFRFQDTLDFSGRFFTLTRQSTTCDKVAVCVREYFNPPTDLNSWNSVCDWSVGNLGATVSTIPLGPSIYTLSFAAPPGSTSPCSVSVKMTAKLCSLGKYEQDCRLTSFSIVGFTGDVRLHPKQSVAFYYPERSSLMLKATEARFTFTGFPGEGKPSVTLYMKEGDYPHQSVTPPDYKNTTSSVGQLTLSVPVPVQSSFNAIYFILINSGSENATITRTQVQDMTCPPRTAGVDCSLLVPLKPEQGVLVRPTDIRPSYWLYLALGALTNDQVAVGLKASAMSSKVRVLLRYGNVPSATLYDLELTPDSTTAGGAAFYRSPKLVPNDGSGWYVGMYLPSLTGPDDSGVAWLDYPCPSNCSGRGTCNNHICNCFGGVQSFDCKDSPPSPPPTPGPEPENHTDAVLVALGLLAAVLLLGGSVWMYKRRTVDVSYKPVGGRDYLSVSPSGRRTTSGRTEPKPITVGAL